MKLKIVFFIVLSIFLTGCSYTEKIFDPYRKIDVLTVKNIYTFQKSFKNKLNIDFYIGIFKKKDENAFLNKINSKKFIFMYFILDNKILNFKTSENLKERFRPIKKELLKNSEFYIKQNKISQMMNSFIEFSYIKMTVNKKSPR
jgi:hypothetical protein